MKNKYRILKIFVVVGLLAFLLSFSLKRFNNKSQQVQINFIQDDPVYFVTDQMVNALVKKNNPNGKIKDLDIASLEKSLMSIPAVDSANVYLNLNGKLKVEIKQRVPLLRINNGQSEFYVDEKGREFPLSNRFAYPAMLVDGDIPKKDYKALVELVKKIDADKFFKEYFVGINLDDKGNYDLLTDDGYFKVRLGDLSNLDFKLDGFKTFLKKYLIFQDPKQYRIISLKYGNQVIATFRKGYEKDNPEDDDTSPAIPAQPLAPQVPEAGGETSTK